MPIPETEFEKLMSRAAIGVCLQHSEFQYFEMELWHGCPNASLPQLFDVLEGTLFAQVYVDVAEKKLHVCICKYFVFTNFKKFCFNLFFSR